MAQCGVFVSSEELKERQNLFSEDKFKKLANKLLEDYEALAYGRHRVTFDLGDFVLKVPRSESGEEANLNEIQNFEFSLEGNHFFKGKLASCTLIILDGISCVLMEKLIDPCDLGIFDDQLPHWTWKFDMSQAGLCPRTKEIKIYDYGDEDISSDEDYNYMVA